MTDSGATVYVVDDDPFARNGLADLIRSAGLMAQTFASGEEFLAAPRPRVPSCLLLDVDLPGVSGLDLQQELAKSNVQVPIIFLTGYGDIPMSVRAVKAGAANFLTKPFNDEQLLSAVQESIASHNRDGVSLESDLRSEYCFQNIVGKSPAIHKVLEQVTIVAGTDATVLIQGETGTGKELIAQAIHNLSPRHHRPFVRINCAAIPSGLLESEMFGHEKGAFTGALMQRKGRFEMADQGTLFLDEIGDIGLDLQPKLLRAVQEQEFERLGSARTIHVNVRMIAATHRNLREMIREEKFREDLFYRFNVFPIEIPPLRDRREDIPLLVTHFVSKLSRRMGKQIESISSQTMDMLTNYPWKGNVRELANVIERAVIVTRGEELQVPMTALSAASETVVAVSSSSTFKQAEASVIIETLRTTGGRIAGSGGAAEKLGLKRTTLQNKMRRLGITKANYQP
jgi:DNA-binding NtrC family response regulator